MEWTKKQYNAYYNAYMPWIEDKVLGYWGENKTSYTAKGNPLPFPIPPIPSTPPPFLPLTNTPPPNLDKLGTHVTGDKNVNAVQDGVAEGVGGQFAKGGLLSPVGEGISKEGVNRAERGDTGPLDKEKAQKGWTESLSGGLLGGGGGGKK